MTAGEQDPHHGTITLWAGEELAHALGAVILLHGRGGGVDDILSLSDEFDEPRLAYVAPQAADRTWYPNSFLAPIEENEPWLTSALKRIGSVIQELEGKGVKRERIAILGFSQGACLASEFVARNPGRYAALIAFTGGLIGPPDADLDHSGDLAGLPVLLSAGSKDPHVPWSRVEQTAAVFRRMGADIDLRRYPGKPHSINLEELHIAKKLLQAAFATNPAKR
jgi:predicted esterase